MKNFFIAIVVLMSTQLLSAHGTGTTKVKNLYIYNDFVVVKTQNTFSNADSCTYSGANEFLYVATNSDGGKKMYSAILSAYVAGKPLRLAYNGCASWGSTTIPKVYGMSLF